MAKRESAKKQKDDLTGILDGLGDPNFASEEAPDPTDIQRATNKYIIDTARRNAISSMVTKYYKSLLRSNPQALIKDTKLLDIVEKAQALEDEQEESQSKGNITFITLNPRPFKNIEDLQAFHKQFTKALTKKWIDGYIYCYDQRLDTVDIWNPQDDDDFNSMDHIVSVSGIHIHMVVRTIKKKKPSEMTREFMSTMDGYFGNPKHINIKRCTFGKEQGAIDYVLLKKKDEKLEVVNTTGAMHDNAHSLIGENMIKFHNWSLEAEL